MVKEGSGGGKELTKKRNRVRREVHPCFVKLLGMSVIDEVLQANEIYSRTHDLRRLTPRPARKLAVLTCMDTRLSIRTLGLKTGDAHVIRNAGGILTGESRGSLGVTHYLLG